MTELGIALGIALMLEGILYALFPVAMRRYMSYALELAPAAFRRIGLAAACLGLAIVWLLKT